MYKKKIDHRSNSRYHFVLAPGNKFDRYFRVLNATDSTTVYSSEGKWFIKCL